MNPAISPAALEPPEPRWHPLAAVFHDRKAVVGGGILVFFALVATLGPALVGDPSEPLSKPLSPPSTTFWLGTTGQGQDAFAQLVAGARPTLLLAFLVGVASVAIGALAGIAAGARGGWLDAVVRFAIDTFLVIPGLPLVVVVGSYLTGGPLVMAVVLALTGWAWPARVLRAQTLSLRARDFIAAATLVGETRWRLVIGEYLPNLWPLIASCLVNAIVYALGALVGLEFLGLGQAERVTWGTILFWARNDAALITGSWWTFVPAGLCLGVVAFALSLLGSSFDQLAHPRLRPQRAFRKRVGRYPRALEATAVARDP
ncbi:MAG TPA: ABC transporter permease [Polyangia bacterium]